MRDSLLSSSLDLNRGVIDYRRVFWFVVLFELVTLGFMLTGDKYIMIGYGVVVVLPLLVLFLPKEPVIGIPMMFLATGLDFFGQITRQSYLFTFTYFHIIMVLTFLSVFLRYFMSGRTRIPSCNLWAPFFAFLFVLSISLIYTPQFREGFFEFIRLFILGGLILAVILSVDSKARIKLVSWSYIIVPLIISLVTLYEIFTQGSFFQAEVIKVATEMGIPVYRSMGTFKNPNGLAMFIYIGVVFGFSMMFTPKLSIFAKVLIFISIAVTGIALIGSFSRGGWLTTLCGVTMVLLLQRRWSYIFMFIGLIFIAFVVLAATHPEIVLSSLSRFLTIFNTASEASASSRISLIRTGVWMWQDHPILGVGASGYQHYAHTYLDPAMPRELMYVVMPHTIQVKILAEEGIIGLVVASWFFFTVVFHGLRTIPKITDPFMRNAQIGATALIIAFMVGFSVNSELHDNTFYTTIGLLYAIPLVAGVSERKTPLQPDESLPSEGIPASG